MNNTNKPVSRNPLSRHAGRVLLTSMIALGALGAGVGAMAAPDGKPGAGAEQCERHGGDKHHMKRGKRHGGPGADRGHGRMEGFGGPGAGMMMRGLDLTEAQKDKLFELRHAAAPAMRDARKAARKAREQLRAFNKEGAADDAQLQAYATELGNAVAQMAVLRAQGRRDMMAVLTDEQRATLKERMEKRGKRGDRGNRHEGRGHGRGGPDREAPAADAGEQSAG